MEEAFDTGWPGAAAAHWRFAAGKGRGRGRGARGGGPPFGHGRGRRRRGDVRTALLMLLTEEPRNGYQLMQEIEERSGGNWRPSPGSVYPILSQLEDEGLIRAVDRDGSKLFEITDAGRAHLADRDDPTPPWESEDDRVPVGDLKSQVKALNIATAQLMHVGNEQQVLKAVETLTQARRSLYRILAEDDDS